jgi:hypothetical protein
MNWLLEFTGIGLVMLAAFLDWRHPHKPRPPAWKPAK